jgi:hypothetical protein
MNKIDLISNSILLNKNEHTHTHTNTHIYIHTHIYIYIHTHIYTHTYIHTYTHTHTNVPSIRFISEWIPGDYVGGSGGPPMVTVMGDSDEPEFPEVEEDEDGEEKKNDGSSETKIPEKEDIYHENKLEEAPEEGKGEEDEKQEEEEEEEDEDGDEEEEVPQFGVPRKVVNPNFADNPMYPITIHVPGPVQISLYQPGQSAHHFPFFFAYLLVSIVAHFHMS